MNDGSDPTREEETGSPSKPLDRKTLFLAVGFIAALVLLLALNMN